MLILFGFHLCGLLLLCLFPTLLKSIICPSSCAFKAHYKVVDIQLNNHTKCRDKKLWIHKYVELNWIAYIINESPHRFRMQDFIIKNLSLYYLLISIFVLLTAVWLFKIGTTGTLVLPLIANVFLHNLLLPVERSLLYLSLTNSSQ